MRRFVRLLMPLFAGLIGLFAMPAAGTANAWQSSPLVLYSMPGYSVPPAATPRKLKRAREARRAGEARRLREVRRFRADRHWAGRRTPRHLGQGVTPRRAAVRMPARASRRQTSAIAAPVASMPRLAALGDQAAPLMHRSVPASGRVEAHVDIRAQRMVVRVDGAVAHVWKVSTARQGFVTPRGVYGPQRMHKTYFSKKYYNSPMPYSIFFKGGYAVHGTNAVKALGGPASHGCIRLATGNARTLFTLMQNHGPRQSRIIIS